MKKYKLKKDFYDYFEKGDIVSDNGMYYEDDTNYSYCSVLDLIFKISKKEVLEEWFEEIKEEETIQWKVGDKYCFEGYNYKTFGIIDRLRIEGGKYYMWGAGERWYLLDETRLAIPEEIQKYFN